jgi:lipoprotein-releasing system permease protein
VKHEAVLFLAVRNIMGRKGDKGDLARKTLRGAVLSVAVSMIPLVVTLVVSDGMIAGITSRYVELSSYHIQCVPYLAPTEDDLSAALASIRKVPGVQGAWAETQSVGIVFAKGVRSGAIVRAVDPGFLKDPGTREYLSVKAGLADLSGPNDVLLGSELARDLGAVPGDVVNLISVRSRSGTSIVPRVSVFKVRGVVSSGYRDLDSRWFLVPRSSAGRYLTSQTSRTILGVKTNRPHGALDSVTEGIENVLPKGWGVYPWQEVEKNLYESFRTTRYLLLLIMGLTVAVAAVNISSALVTLVMERSREIAILKGVGASPRDIRRIFIAGGLMLGAAGSTLGIAFGALVSVHINGLISGLDGVLEAVYAVFLRLAAPFAVSGAGAAASEPIRILNPDYYLEHIPVNLDFWALAAILAFSLFLSYLASLLPAKRAASLSPQEIMRRH